MLENKYLVAKIRDDTTESQLSTGCLLRPAALGRLRVPRAVRLQPRASGEEERPRPRLAGASSWAGRSLFAGGAFSVSFFFVRRNEH